MDETQFLVDSIPTTTLNAIGARQVDIETTGNEKDRMSVVITCTLSDLMLPTYVILKNLKYDPKCAIPNDIISEASGIGGTGFMNENLMVKYIDKVLKPYLKDRPCLLIFDKLKAHKTDIFLDYMKKNNIQQFLIDAGFTSELQPVDVCINEKTNEKRI
jgi:hypothetical protein